MGELKARGANGDWYQAYSLLSRIVHLELYIIISITLHLATIR